MKKKTTEDTSSENTAVMEEVDVTKLAEERPAAGDDAQLKATLEAIVYVTDEPLSAQQIAAALERPLDIVKRALEEPARCIAQNAGVEGSVVVERLKTAADGVGYNAATDVYEDMIKAGIVDPAKVTRSALQNAASIAGLMLTTEAMVCEIPEKKSAPAPGGHGPEGMDY